MNELAKLAVDLYKGRVTNYSSDDAMEVLRQELIEKNGGSDKLTPKSFRKNPELFEILEEALDVLIVDGLENQFDDFVETHVLDWGDTKVFTIPENRLFDVSIVSDGNGDLRRDRLDSGEVTVSTKTYAVAIYEELHRLLAGRVDWASMVDRIARSYNQKIQSEIYNALFNTFDALGEPYGVGAAGAFDEAEMLTLISHVEAATGMEAVIMGTKRALSQVENATVSDAFLEMKNRMGYYGTFQGTPMVEIKQSHKAGTNEFAINDDTLIVTPRVPDGMVKLILEGDSLIEETGEGRLDMQREYKFIKKAGFSVISSSKYGIYRLA